MTIQRANKQGAKQVRICEIFTGISGETGLIPVGSRTIFLRFGGCNLHCEWCDTPDTIDPRDTPLSCMFTNLKTIQKEITSTGIQNVLITGGEPLLNPEGLLTICQCLKKHNGPDLVIQVETNGTFVPSRELQQYVDCFVYDVKPPSSGYIDIYHSGLPYVIRAQDTLKCVIVENSDLPYYMEDRLAWIYDLPCPVMFSVNEETAPITIEFLDSLEGNNYGVSVQIHKIIKAR